MPLLILGAGLLLALVTTLILVFPLRSLALSKGWVDMPDGNRKLHRRPTATVGGVVIVGGFAMGYGLLVFTRSWLPVEWTLPSFSLWAGAIGIVAAGLYDDIRNLTFRQKFVIQVVAALLLVHAGYRFDLSTLPFGSDPLVEVLYSVPISVLWIVGVTNAVNLIDGMDGLATGVAYIGLAFFALIFSVHGNADLLLLVIPLIGALAGFLIHNFNRATIFMGDSGSLFLGFMLAAASLHGPTHTNPTLALLIPVLVLGVPVLDTFLSIVRRGSSGKPVFTADRDHIHHRLLRTRSPRFVALVLYAAAVGFGLSAFIMSLLDARSAFTVFGMVLAAIGVGVYGLGYFRTASSDETDEQEYESRVTANGSVATEPVDAEGEAVLNGAAPMPPQSRRQLNKYARHTRYAAPSQGTGSPDEHARSNPSQEARPSSTPVRNGKESRAEASQ